jgi:hypothetical protein
MTNDPVGPIEDSRGERKKLGSILPDRRQEAVDDPVRKKPADNARVALHRVEVSHRIATPDRQPGHEVVKDEVVHDDDPPVALNRVDDPTVRLRVVSDVIESQV